MTYRRNYYDNSFSAISEANLTGGSGQSFSVGDSFVYSGADATITVSDNDRFLAGDSRRNERGNDYQSASIDTGNGTIDAGNLYVESYHILYGSDGRYYFLAEIEGTGLSNDLSQDDYFSFIGRVPPAGVELTSLAQRNVYGGIRYDKLGAGDVVDPDGDPNNAPIVSGDVDLGVLDEDTALTITAADLLANATDADGDVLSVQNVIASSGTLTDNGDGTFTFNPDENDDGDVAFSYLVSDGTDTVAASASLDLTSVNDAPTLNGPLDLGAIDEDTTRTITIAEIVGDVTDVDGDVLNVTSLSSSSGTITNLSNGDFSFTPDANDDTDVTFEYVVSDGIEFVTGTATLDLTPVNDAPEIVNSDLGTIREGSNILSQGGVVDPEGDSITLLSVSASIGEAILSDIGNFEYEFTAPEVGPEGETVTLTFVYSDGTDTSTGTRTAFIRDNDAPIASGPVDLGTIDDTGERFIFLSELTTNTSDPDGDRVFFDFQANLPDRLEASSGSVTSGASFNDVTGRTESGFLFTSDPNADGEVTFIYNVTDGLESISTSATLDLLPDIDLVF